MVGSEGTLGVVLEAKLNLVPLPAAKAVLAIQFADLLEALAATPLILRHQPSAIEVMDKFILDHTRQSAQLDALRNSFIEGDPGAMLCVEFYADRPEDLPPRLQALEQDLRARGLGYRFHHALDLPGQARIWSLREAALGLSMAMKDDAKSISFVEDTAVAPEKLRDYIEQFLQLIQRHGTSAGVYAHASVGCLHVRPVVNLKTEEGVRKFEAIANDGRRPRARVRRRAVGRAWRRPGAQPVHGEDVRPGAVRGVPHHQAHVRSPRHLQSGQDRRCAAADGEPALRRADTQTPTPGHVLRLLRVRRLGRRRRDVQRPRRVPQEARRHDVSRRTWRRARKPTRRAAAPTCCAWRWPGGSAKRASATRASTRCSICASSAARARPNVRSASTWRDSRASFSPTTGRGTACRRTRACSGTRERWRSGAAASPRCRTGS